MSESSVQRGTYALTIQEAYLKMRRAIKELDEKWADIYGVRSKPKRKKSREY